MPYTVGQKTPDGAYTFNGTGWYSTPGASSVTGPAGSNPQYQANANATPPGQLIQGPTLEGRGLPGGTPGQKLGNLATAVSSGFGVGKMLGGAGAGAASTAAPKITPPSPSSPPTPNSWGPDANRFVTNVQNNIKALQPSNPTSPAGPTAPTAVQSLPKGAPGPAGAPKTNDWKWISKLTAAETGKDLIGHMIKALLNAQ
jgi:hypothetical protein